MNPNGHFAIVTGGASGLGEATARRLAQAGAKVAIVDRNFALAEAVANDIGGRAYGLDVTDSAAAEAFFVQLASEMGVARILVNCAGLALAKRIVGRDGPHGLDEFAKIMNVNVMGSFNMLRLAASKGAIVSLTLPAARELAQFGIRVLAIAPGLFHTPLVAALPQAAQDSLAVAIPYPARLGHPDEFGHLVLHCVENIYLNGETIRLDGALRMAPK